MEDDDYEDSIVGRLALVLPNPKNSTSEMQRRSDGVIWKLPKVGEFVLIMEEADSVGDIPVKERGSRSRYQFVFKEYLRITDIRLPSSEVEEFARNA